MPTPEIHFIDLDEAKKILYAIAVTLVDEEDPTTINRFPLASIRDALYTVAQAHFAAQKTDFDFVCDWKFAWNGLTREKTRAQQRISMELAIERPAYHSATGALLSSSTQSAIRLFADYAGTNESTFLKFPLSDPSSKRDQGNLGFRHRSYSYFGNDQHLTNRGICFVKKGVRWLSANLLIWEQPDIILPEDLDQHVVIPSLSSEKVSSVASSSW